MIEPFTAHIVFYMEPILPAKLAGSLRKLSTTQVVVANFTRPVGGTHKRTGCQCCGGAVPFNRPGRQMFIVELPGDYETMCETCFSTPPDWWPA